MTRILWPLGTATDQAAKGMGDQPLDGAMDATSLKAVAVWVARGFPLLTGLATAFGIQAGALDRILRTEPTAALWVFAMIGAAVLCAVVAPAAKEHYFVPVWPIAALVTGLCLVTWLLLPKLRDQRVNSIPDVIAFLIFIALLLGALRLGAHRVSVMTALLVVAMTALSLGLYSAVKVTVLDKLGPETPRVTAEFENQPTGTVIKLRAVAGARDTKPLLVAVRGTVTGGPGQGAVETIGFAQLGGDSTGAVDATAAYPVSAARWRAFSVGFCDEPEPCLNGDWSSFQESAFLPGRRSQASVTASLQPVGKSLRVDVAATQLEAGAFIRAQVARLRDGRSTPLALHLLAPGADGSVKVGQMSFAAIPGDILVVSYRRCLGTPANCDAQAHEAARILMPT